MFRRIMKAWSLAAFALAILMLPTAIPAPVVAPTGQPVPCRDPRGCPDMTIDVSQLLVTTTGDYTVNNNVAGNCLIAEGYLSGYGRHHLLRFNLGAPNVGLGDLVLGKPADNPDLFFWSACHGHWHLRDYITTRVWTPTGWLAWEQLRLGNPDWNATNTFDAHPELKSEMLSAAKVSFCAVDIYPQPANQGGATVPDLLKYTDCDNQGVSRGWSDLYIYSQLGNWADITGLAPGPYVLEAEVNTFRIFQESNYANNRGAVPVVVR